MPLNRGQMSLVIDHSRLTVSVILQSVSLHAHHCVGMICLRENSQAGRCEQHKTDVVGWKRTVKAAQVSALWVTNVWRFRAPLLWFSSLPQGHGQRLWPGMQCHSRDMWIWLWSLLFLYFCGTNSAHLLPFECHFQVQLTPTVRLFHF